MTWKQGYGGTHPNKIGYQFASDLITGAIKASPKPSRFPNGKSVKPSIRCITEKVGLWIRKPPPGLGDGSLVPSEKKCCRWEESARNTRSFTCFELKVR